MVSLILPVWFGSLAGLALLAAGLARSVAKETRYRGVRRAPARRQYVATHRQLAHAAGWWWS